MAPEKTSGKMTRREALKALSAASGAILTAAMLPDKWAKPVVGSGVLPAHAQASRIFEIVECDIISSQEAPVNSTALITPVEKDISLTCDWVYQAYVPDDSNIVPPPVTGSLIGLTDELGVTQVMIPLPQSEEILWGLVTCTWKFTNPLDGTDTCSTEQIFDMRPG